MHVGHEVAGWSGRLLCAAGLWAACSSFAEGARADAGRATTALPTPVDALASDLAAAFSGYNLLFYAGAVSGTAFMAYGGVDQAIRVGTQEHLAAPAFADGSLYAGYFVPAVVAPGLYLVGLVAKDPVVTGAGSAAVQSLGVMHD